MRVDLKKIVSPELLAGQINELNIQNEINVINSEIHTMLQQSAAGQPLFNTALLQRINACIQVLELAYQELSKKNALKTKKNLLNSLPATSSDQAKAEAKQAFADAQRELDFIKSQVSGQYSRREIRLAIMEGYIIVTQLREQVTGEVIDYKIMSAGQEGDKTVLFEAKPTLAQVLSKAHLDSKTFSLRLVATQKQFNTILKHSEAIDDIIPLKNSVLAQMKRVQLSAQEQNMWDRLLKVQHALEGLPGAYINYGQLIESFEEYLFMGPDDNLNEIEYIYQLLEKGRNNLAYYLGSDVDIYQIKALATMGGQGRADAATLTNVLNPLKEIRDIMIVVNGNSAQALVNFFTAKQGQGDRPFNPALEQEIKKRIKNALTQI